MSRRKKQKPMYISLEGGINKDFHVRVIQEERLVSTIPALDTTFDEDMYNYGDMNDLPESDRIMICQQRGIRQEDCGPDA